MNACSSTQNLLLDPLRCRFRVRWRVWLLFIALTWMPVATQTARAELVVLHGGDIIKASAHQLEDRATRLRIDLRSGGTLVLPIDRVERIVDDEVPDRSPTPSYSVPIHFESGQSVPATPFGALIYRKARAHSLNPSLVAALVRVESGFDPQALSNKGARGLLQLMPATAARFGVGAGELYDPTQNIEAGVSYLAWLARRFRDDLPRMLAAYNAGEAMVERYHGVPPFRETRNYIRRVYASLGVSAEPVLPGR